MIEHFNFLVSEIVKMRKVRGKTKFLTEPYMEYGEEKIAVLTKKFPIFTISA